MFTARFASRRVRRGAAGVAVAVLATGTVMVGSAAAATVACGSVITRDTTLTANVGPCPGAGIVVAANNITLDLNGHTVSGNPRARRSTDEVGIRLRQVRGVTVQNGTVKGFDAGVAIGGGGDNAVRGITARDNVNYRVVTGRNSQPQHIVPDVGPYCEFGDGITVYNSTSNVISGNVVFGNAPFSGISLLSDADENVVESNSVHDNDLLNETPDGRGTTCGSTANGPIDNPPPSDWCCARHGRHSQDVGVRIEGPSAERNRVENNSLVRNGLAGVLVTGYQTAFPGNNGFNVIRGNTIFETGLRVHNSTGDTTEAYRSSGIHLHHAGSEAVHVSYGNLIANNVSSRNFAAGIEVGGPQPGSGRVGQHGNTIRGNVVNDNLLDGIHLAEGTVKTTVTDNQGFGNGHNQQVVDAISDADVFANWAGVDGADMNPRCGSNSWSRNRFGTVNQRCVAAHGTGQVEGDGLNLVRGSKEPEAAALLGEAQRNGMPFQRGRPAIV